MGTVVLDSDEFRFNGLGLNDNPETCAGQCAPSQIGSDSVDPVGVRLDWYCSVHLDQAVLILLGSDWIGIVQSN